MEDLKHFLFGGLTSGESIDVWRGGEECGCSFWICARKQFNQIKSINQSNRVNKRLKKKKEVYMQDEIVKGVKKV